MRYADHVTPVIFDAFFVNNVTKSPKFITDLKFRIDFYWFLSSFGVKSDDLISTIPVPILFLWKKESFLESRLNEEVGKDEADVYS